MVVLTDL